MNADASTLLFSSDRALIDVILDQLIPANPDKGIPAAGGLGIADYLGDVAARDPAVAKALETLFTGARDWLSGSGQSLEALALADQTALVSWLQQTHADHFEVLLSNTYMGYYSRPDTRELLGLSALPTQPNGYAVPLESREEISALTRTVRERGPCYRSC